MKYKAILLRKEGESYIEVGQIKFDKTDTEIIINKTKTVPINLQIAYRKGGTSYIFIDLDSEAQIKFNEWKTGIDGEDVDAIVTKRFLTDLFHKIKSGTEMTDKSHILMYIIVLLAGIAIGSLIGIVLYPIIVPTPVAPISNVPTV